ncbi:GNAT family N-acetyltransferase [Micromonospora sp. DSM 115977]|uniref:GNAT family N-acetyltransferase n=1 Tax=Micromonospora reichwaldensis TaxID=3075516 RepID=A0ABU2X0Z0_9ACTN|nr:GNAT family N-acetyltransferase [Micromonospora sp. DSM 115977]MDT0531839.1 GNAT family N-acetyltransferase [Micromonospora sp. DSM 115977]
MFTLTRDDGYLLSTDPARIDLGLVHHWLCTDAYWALGRDRETVARAFAGSVPFGVYRPGDGRQVAVARVVTDHATFAWLCDVYVDPGERGRGLGTWLAGAVRDHLAELGVRRILLATADAHAVYAKVGFAPMTDPHRWMQLDQRNQPVSPITGKEPGGLPALTVET